MSEQLETVLHTYYYDVSDPEQAEAYDALCAKLANHPHRMHAIGDFYTPLKWSNGVRIPLETEHLFNNQWNTGPIAQHPNGYRVFDWAEEACLPNEDIKRGHWLEQTAEMKAIRDNTAACGYCGKQEPAAKGYAFCPHCLDSKYLQATELHLTRMVPVSQDQIGKYRRAPLTDAESAHLMPLYVEAQTAGSTERGKLRLAAQRQAIALKLQSTRENAQIEHDGLMWLLDRGLKIDNVIFYSHTGRFGFGWRTPLTGDLRLSWLEWLAEFPFPYDVK